VEFLVKNGVRVVGIDYLSIEAFDTKDNVWRDYYKSLWSSKRVIQSKIEKKVGKSSRRKLKYDVSGVIG
jgi:kynurenine formamidase